MLLATTGKKAAGTASGFQETIKSARASLGWSLSCPFPTSDFRLRVFILSSIFGFSIFGFHAFCL
jgi:hypothetical protein